MLSTMTTTSTSAIVVYVTCPPDQSTTIATTIIEEQLAACVNILPHVRSIYRWEGEVCDDGESLLMINTVASGFERLRQRIERIHPYDVPEIIALDVREGHLPYLAWVAESVLPESN